MSLSNAEVENLIVETKALLEKFDQISQTHPPVAVAGTHIDSARDLLEKYIKNSN